MSKPVIAYKNLSGEVYHIPENDQELINRPALCRTRTITSTSIATQFEDIKNPNICRHCAIEFQRKWVQHGSQSDF